MPLAELNCGNCGANLISKVGSRGVLICTYCKTIHVIFCDRCGLQIWYKDFRQFSDLYVCEKCYRILSEEKENYEREKKYSSHKKIWRE